MHIRVDYYQEKVTREDQAIKSQFEAKMSDADKIARVIFRLEHEKEEWTKELQLIEKAAARFGSFLQQNAILTYNDVTGKCFDVLIEEEEKVAADKQNRDLLDTLKQGKARYVEECRIIEKAIARDPTSVCLDPDSIDSWVRDLFRLKHSGQSLKKAFEKVGKAEEMVYREVPFSRLNPLKQKNPDKGHHNHKASSCSIM